MKVIQIQNTFRSHCESISQSINEYSLINKIKIGLSIFIGLVLVLWLWQLNSQ